MRCVRVAALGLLGACLVMPAVATGQTGVTFGPMGGLSLARFHGSDVGTQKTRTGFAAGGFAEVGLQRNVALAFQLLYIQKGAKADDPSLMVEETFKLDYIEIPALLKVMFETGGASHIVPNLFVGPALAFRSKCKLKATSGGTTLEATCSDAGLDIKSTDFSVIFGGGVDIGAFTVQGRYDLGLTNIESGSGAADAKTSAWVFTVGWRVPMRK